MNRQEELAVGRRLFGHIDGRTTDLADALFRNKVINYSCRERAALERERLFRSLPIFMGLSTRLPKPGDYLTEDVAGMPVLMTRGADGCLVQTGGELTSWDIGHFTAPAARLIANALRQRGLLP